MDKTHHRTVEKELWKVFDKLRGVEFHGPEELAEFLKYENIHFTADELVAFGTILATRYKRLGPPALHIPGWLADVYSKLLEDISPQIICDPWAGAGLLIAVLREGSNPIEAIALTENQGNCALGKVLVPEAEWQVGDPLRLLDNLEKKLDLAASILPMDVRAEERLKVTLPSGENVELRDNLGNLVLVAASMRLSSSGVGLFVVTPSFFLAQRSVFQRFADLGLSVKAAFALPPGTFAPYTNIPAYLLIVRREPSTQMFVGQFSADTNTNRYIIDNYRQNRQGGAAELGRFVDADSFRSLDAIRSAERFALAERRFGAPAVSLDELATAINLGRFGDDFAFPALGNAIFVPLIGASDVQESVGDFTLKKQNYAQVVIDPARSNARFVARFLNSELGKELREQGKSGTVIPKLTKATLKELRIFVPDLETQENMLELEARIGMEQNTILVLQNELSELRRDLWSNPLDASNVKKRLGIVTKGLQDGVKQHASARLDHGFETLPFPLASILRAWQATESNDFKTKYELLLKFFEASAEFFAVIMLSAYSTNEAFFAPHKTTLVFCN